MGLVYAFNHPATEATPATDLYLSPLREFTDGSNPFRHHNRRFAVDLGVPRDEILMVSLNLPAGYELAALPKNAVVELPGGGARFVYSAVANGATVQLVSRLWLRNPEYSAAQYDELRELYRLMLEKQGEKLVIKKKA
jgi:hypothetical protein